MTWRMTGGTSVTEQTYGYTHVNHGFSLLPKFPLDVVLLICSLFGPRQLAISLATKANNLILRWVGALRGDGSTEKNVAYIHI